MQLALPAQEGFTHSVSLAMADTHYRAVNAGYLALEQHTGRPVTTLASLVIVHAQSAVDPVSLNALPVQVDIHYQGVMNARIIV